MSTLKDHKGGAVKQSLSITDIKDLLACSNNHARKIMLMELPHTNIGSIGSRNPTWRAKRSDFEKWQADRTDAAGNDKLDEFRRKYMTGKKP